MNKTGQGQAAHRPRPAAPSQGGGAPGLPSSLSQLSGFLLAPLFQHPSAGAPAPSGRGARGGLLTQPVALLGLFPPPARLASCHSSNGCAGVHADLTAEAGRRVGHHNPPARRQRRQSRDFLPIVIIFALRRDLSLAAATTCLQDTTAMKTRLTKPARELFSLARVCRTSPLTYTLAGPAVSGSPWQSLPSQPTPVFPVRAQALTPLPPSRIYRCCRSSTTAPVVPLFLSTVWFFFLLPGKTSFQKKLSLPSLRAAWPVHEAWGLLLGFLLSPGSCIHLPLIISPGVTSSFCSGRTVSGKPQQPVPNLCSVRGDHHLPFGAFSVGAQCESLFLQSENTSGQGKAFPWLPGAPQPKAPHYS